MLFIGIVYCIIAKGSNLIYYGSSTKSKEERFRKHKNKLNCSSKRLIILPNCRMEELCRFENEDKDVLKQKLRTIEKECILKHRLLYPGECVNIYLPFATEEEHKARVRQYKLENRDEYNRKVNEQNALNRDKINNQQNERRAKNKDKINRQVRERRAKNRDEFNRQTNERIAKNRDEYNRKARERYAKKKLVATLGIV